MLIQSESKNLYVGCISGTSLDGLDIAVVQFRDEAYPDTKAAATVKFPPDLHQQLLSLTVEGENEIVRMGQADFRLGRFIGEQILDLLRAEDIAIDQVHAIGSHGQTIRHHPEGDLPFTLQIGNPNVITEVTGIMTVADFRSRDIAAGGEGAPLANVYHRYLFAHPKNDRAVVNVGGMSNITFLRAEDGSTTGFDAGPGNVLLDGWCQARLDSELDYSGNLSARGEVISDLLALCLEDDYFSREPPKSTGREYFNMAWLEQRLAQFQNAKPEDVLTTLVYLTADSIAQAVKAGGFCPEVIWLCGGGRHNTTLLLRLAELCPESEVHPVEHSGMNGDFIEAAAFGYMAKEYLLARPANIPEVTGASGRRLLGALYLP